MSATLVVRKPGICSTLQDLGRSGYRAYGVPVSGALDAVACRLANLVVGNATPCAAIEMMYSGVSVEVQAGTARVAVCGAEASVISGVAVRTLSPLHSTTIGAGDTLRIGTITDSAVAYLAIEGGFAVAPVLGSQSTYLRGTLGGFAGGALKRGDVLVLWQDRASQRAERRLTRRPALRAPSALRVMPGPQGERFEKASLDLLVESEYVVSPSSDRSGLRLDGPALAHVGGYDTNSEGVATGSIQVPGSGTPVILIGDHPTVGGYPKIATIISADIPAAGRLRIGSRFRFSAVDEDEAARARREASDAMQEIAASMVEVG